MTAFFAQLERQTAYTAQLVVSLVDSSHLQLKAPKFALVLAKTEHILQKMPLAVARQDSTSTRPKASVRDSPVLLRTAFQLFTTFASKERSEVQQEPVSVQQIAQRNACRATELETQFQAFANVLMLSTLTRSATRTAGITRLLLLCPRRELRLLWFRMEQP